MISFGLEDSFVLKLVIVVVRVVFASLHVNPDIHGHACLPSEKKRSCMPSLDSRQGWTTSPVDDLTFRIYYDETMGDDGVG
jgi:hypothetical protein